MAEVLGFNIPINAPKFGIGTGKIWIVLFCFIITLIIAVVIYLIYLKRTFNRKIVVFENIGGLGFQPSYKDTARVVKLGDGGEEILFLKKKKVFRTAYGRKMGQNTYWFAIGQDGYWYNVVLGDVDTKMGLLDIEPIDRDMRYMNTAIRKNIVERYRKISFMERYGAVMISGIFLLIMLVGLYFLMDKLGTISKELAGAVKVGAELQATSQQIISSMDNLCTGGAGVLPT